MRPPIPGAHPAVTVQDGCGEEGEITHVGPFSVLQPKPNPWGGILRRPRLNKIISFWTAWPLIKLL